MAATKTSARASLRELRLAGKRIDNLFDRAGRHDLDERSRRIALQDAGLQAEEVLLSAQIAAREIREYVWRELRK